MKHKAEVFLCICFFFVGVETILLLCCQAHLPFQVPVWSSGIALTFLLGQPLRRQPKGSGKDGEADQREVQEGVGLR